MKQIILTLFLLTLATTSTVSQNSPNQREDKDPLTGSWDATADHWTRDGKEILERTYTEKENIYVFGNGKMTVYEKDGTVLDECTYTYDPDSKILTMDGFLETPVLKLTKTEMDIELYESSDTFIFRGRRTFKRIE